MAGVDILIPTCGRPGGLAVTLAGLLGQRFEDFRVVVSDQSQDDDPFSAGEVLTALRALRARGHEVDCHRHLPRRGIAEHRSFLLDSARSELALFLDDDMLLEPEVVGRLVATMDEQRCGFVGAGMIGLSYADDVRPSEQRFEPWDGPVQPEVVEHGTPAWERSLLHNAANLLHVAERLGLGPEDRVAYKVAWVAGCVLFDVAKLREVGGFDFWPELPSVHVGEDVLVQLRLLAAHGGCGVLPSGAYHQELPTTFPDRRVDAPHYFTSSLSSPLDGPLS